MKVPCIICLKEIEVSDSKIIASVCKACLTDKNIENIGKNFTMNDLTQVLDKFRNKQTTNEFGEAI